MRWIWTPLLLLALASCKENDEPFDPGPTDYPGADQMVADLQQALDQRNFPLFDGTLHADFLYEFATADIAASGDPSGIWSRAQEMAAISNMFSGAPGQNYAPVVSIDATLTPLGSLWIPATDAGLENTLHRRYRLMATITLSSFDSIDVDSLVEFYALEVGNHYELRYWKDEGLPGLVKRADTISWGALQADY